MSQNPTSSLETTTEKPRRRWYQFSLNFMLAVTMLSAAIVSVWMQSRKLERQFWKPEPDWNYQKERAEIAEGTKKLQKYYETPEVLRYKFDYYQLIGALTISLDLEKSKHREALALIQKIHKVDGLPGNFQIKPIRTEFIDFAVVMIQSSDGPRTVERAGTVLALVQKEKVIDWIVRPSGSDGETWHETNLTPLKDPTKGTLEFLCYPHGQNRDGAFKVTYLVTKIGFVKIDK